MYTVCGDRAGGLCSDWEGLEALVRMALVAQDGGMRSLFVCAVRCGLRQM